MSDHKAYHIESTITMSTQAIAIFIALGFIISILYDWGFCNALNINFSTLPTTISDHFRTGLAWFPKLISVVLFIVAGDFFFRKIEKWKSEDELVENSKYPRFTGWFRKSPRKLIAILSVVIFLKWLFIGDSYGSIGSIFISIAWFSFAAWCISVRDIDNKLSRIGQISFLFIPVIFIFAFFSGYNDGLRAAIREPDHVVIETINSLHSTQGTMLRVFDKGILILTDKNYISFIQWNQIYAVSSSKPFAPFSGVLCEWLSVCAEDANTNK